MTTPTPAPAPAPEAPSAANALVVVTPTTVITKFQVLADTIARAKQAAPSKNFNYADKKENKECRSYLATLRSYNGDIDRAHDEAKADVLEEGRRLDALKNALKWQVAALIQPHKAALDEIARKEAERVAAHKRWLSTVQNLARVPFGSDSKGIKEMMLELDLYEQSVDLLEEFTLEGKAALVDATRVLRDAHTKALTEEAAAAELARLREEAAAEVARKAQEAASAAPARVDAPAPARVDAPAQARVDAPAQGRAEVTRRNDLAIELSNALVGKTRPQVVEALLDDTFHPAVFIDWSKA